MLLKDFVLRMNDIKEHVRLIDCSFVPRFEYVYGSRIVDLVNELECLAAELREDLTSEITC